MKTIFTLLLCLAASVASAYEGTSFQALIEVGYPVIQLAKENSAEKGNCLNYSGPKLDQQWKPFSFVFIPQADGTVLLRFGPAGVGDIPFYYSDIKINGTPLDNSVWNFSLPSAEGQQTGSVASSPDGKACLKIYFGCSAYYFIKVKKGERMEVSMRGKSGSVLDAYINRLSDVARNLDDAGKIGVPLQGAALDVGKKLAGELNRLSALSDTKLHVSVSPLAPENATLESLKAKTLEWTNAFEAEKARTANDERPCLYEQPADRTELKKLVVSAVRQSAQVQTACLLEFLLKR